MCAAGSEAGFSLCSFVEKYMCVIAGSEAGSSLSSFDDHSPDAPSRPLKTDFPSTQSSDDAARPRDQSVPPLLHPHPLGVTGASTSQLPPAALLTSAAAGECPLPKRGGMLNAASRVAPMNRGVVAV